MIKRKMKGGKNSMLIMKTFLTAMPNLTKIRVASSARSTTLLTKMRRSSYKHSGELKTSEMKLRKIMTCGFKCKVYNSTDQDEEEFLQTFGGVKDIGNETEENNDVWLQVQGLQLY